MMFECIDKIYPSVSIETLTGSICSFNDEYGGLPLKSCVSKIIGYQEGSGTPSPSNVRNLVSFNSATLTENGNTHLFTFGQSIYQGSVDWKRGVVVGTWGIDVYDGSNDENWNVQGIAGFRIDNTAKKAGMDNYLADNYQATNESGWDISIPNGYFSGHPAIQRFYFRTPYDGFELSLENWRSWLSSNPITVVYELATPIEIPLGGINLLTQEGQNNIFCDTGDTTLEYIKIV